MHSQILNNESMDAEKKNAKKNNYQSISKEPEFCSKDHMGNNGAGQLNRWL